MGSEMCIRDSRDIDSDNDGITDNVEAQTTAGYIAPSGQGAAFVDANRNGLDDNYEVAPGTAGFNADGIGLAAVDTDSTLSSADGVTDYLDNDSDNDGISDQAESGLAAATSTADTDGDGLLDDYEGSDVDDGYDVNDENRDATSIALADSDGDLGGDPSTAIALDIDADFREALDTDGDNVHDEQDIDDDNDGILDVLSLIHI